jgi:hypothetical protein
VKTRRGLIVLVFLSAVMLLPMAFTPQISTTSGDVSATPPDSTDETRLVDIGGGQMIELAPNEELHRFVLTEQGWVEWQGTSDPLVGAEYGNSTTLFSDSQIQYIPGSGTTDFTGQVPIGTGWEAYEAQVEISGLTENRTWFVNPGFTGSATGWTIVPTNGAGSSTVSGRWVDDGHGTNDDCVEVEIDSDSTSAPYYYDNNDQAWLRQSIAIDRGAVTWAGFRVDYWADTQDDTHYGMTGSFLLYLNVEGQYVWQKVFEDIDAEETWYDSGLVTINPSVFTDGNILAEIGLWSKAGVGYAPEIGPLARFDNFQLYLKMLVDPSDINLQMNGIDVQDGASPGFCSVTQAPSTPWDTSPVDFGFEWTPTPATPNPDSVINVNFDAEINLYARHLDIDTVYEISPTSYGEQFIVLNGTAANFTSFFRADIPTGYSNRYYFNETLPLDRDVYFVGKPLAPSTNLTTGWTGGDPGDGYLDVTAYAVTTEAGRYGYWRILSSSPNMITDLRLWDGDSWERDVEFRAGESTQIRVYLGAGFTGSQVNISVYEPDGSVWNTYTAFADGSGYATTGSISFPGGTAPAGEWMVQASTNNIGAGGVWSSVGLFKRPFSIKHSSDLELVYPTDAISTLETNVTFGDLLLIIMEAEDTDSSVLVPGGTLTLDWVLGSDTFDDSANGQYTKVIDTSLLPRKGQYAMSLTWDHPSYDSAISSLTINVNYPASLTSPQYPGIEGPVGDSQTFRVRFANVNGTGITGATISCDWSNPYSVTPIGSGVYEFQLNTAGIPIGEYPIQIDAKKIFVEPQSLVMYVEVREIYNSISYTSNELSIPLGEASSFLFTWYDTDHSSPVQGSASSISCNWTSFHTSGEMNYTVVETTPGTYNITIYTESDDPLTGSDLFTVTFDVQKPNYQNHTFDIGVEIRKRNTLFVLDEPVSQTPFGDTIYVLVFYQDTDLRVGIGNGTSEVRITVTTSELGSLVYSSSPSSLGVGHYNISIPTSQWGSIGSKDLTIFVEWIGAVDKFYSQTILTSVRITGTDTDLYLEQAPTATYYENTFVFSAVYWDMIGAQRISNATNHVFVSVTPLDAGHSVTQADFLIYESGTVPGTYFFNLDSDLLPSTGTFRFELMFMWEKGASPLYENRTMTVSLVILARPTYIDYAPVASTPYGEDAQFSFSYVDTLTSTRIPNSGQLTVTLNDIGVSYSVSYNSLTREFTVTIDTTSLGGIGTHVLHLNVSYTGAPFYASVGSRTFTVTVILRATQLSHLSFAPGQWGNNVSIVFVYTDLVSGITAGMTGALSLNIPASVYTVVYLGSGQFLVELNTTAFASDGLFSITATVVHTNPNYADGVETFDFSVLKRSTQIGYDSPDPTPYLNNVSFVLTYTDDSTARGIAGAIISITSNGTSSLVLDSNYWVTYQGNGQYLIEVASTALGAPDVYQLSVTVSFADEPFYLGGTRPIIARVTQRVTQILITKTPGETPFLEEVVLRFRYTDFLTGAKITIDKSHITLTHGPSHTLIASGDYTLINNPTYYEIRFNSTLLNPSALVSSYEIQIAIDVSAGSPYYAPRSTTTRATTVQRQTQILFPLVADTPYFDNITLEFSYIDYLTGTGIDGATVLVTSVNGTIPSFTLTRLGGGLYRVSINSTVFGGIGTVFFDISLSRDGIPFYSARSTTNVPAAVKLVQTSLLALAPPAGSTAIGVPIVVTLTLKDFDHGVFLEGATIQTNWSLIAGTGYSIAEIGNGVYELTLTTAGLLAQRYTFQVWGLKTFYQTAVATVSVQPGAATVEITMGKTAYFVDWGEIVNITFQVIEPFYGTPVPDGDATLLWNGSLYYFSDLDGGYYGLLLDTSDADFGTFSPQVTFTREFYQPRTVSFTLVVDKATGQILPAQSVFDIVIDTSIELAVYLNDTVRGLPVTGATVTMEWNGTVYGLTPTGTPGQYTSNLGVTGFAIGQYPLIVRAVELNHAFLETTVDINVVPIPTQLRLADGRTLITVYFGDYVTVLVVYNDTYHSTLVAGAIVNYTVGSVSGSLYDEGNGTYSGIIDVSSLASQSIYLRLHANKPGYATGLRSIIVTILPIPTEVSVDSITKSNYTGYNLTYTFYYYDTQHAVPIPGANVIASWEGGSGVVTDLGTGYYTVQVHLTGAMPGLYDLVVHFDLTNYTARTYTAKIEVYSTPAEIRGPEIFSAAIYDPIAIPYVVANLLDNSSITDVIGIAYSSVLGDRELVLEDGVYYLYLESDLPYGTYSFDISFSTAKYTMAPLLLEVTVRPIMTALYHGDLEVNTSPGIAESFTFTYFDLDHDVGISGANITIDYDLQNVTFFEDLTTDVNGVYTLYFQAGASNVGKTFYVTITFSKDDYVTQFRVLVIKSDVSAAQQFQQALTVYGGSALMLVALLLVAYVKVWSVPKGIRELNRMIRALAKGRVPKPAKAPTRLLLALAIVNEDLASMKLAKEETEVAPEPIVTTVPEVDELLEELASITGLGDVEIEAFRADLARMKPSERPGFLKEVIDQEKARRADALTKPAKVTPEPEEIRLAETPDELEDLKQKLLKKGMAPEEIEIIVEEAKSLSKADLDALLDSLGIDLD